MGISEATSKGARKVDATKVDATAYMYRTKAARPLAREPLGLRSLHDGRCGASADSQAHQSAHSRAAT